MILTNLYKWNNLTYPRPSIKTPLSSQVKEQPSQINSAVHTDNKNKKKGTSVFDTGATSNCGMVGDDFIETDQPSNKVFYMPTGNNTPASTIAKLKQDTREPARNVDMVPALRHNSLLSGSKFADTNYITVLTPTEVLIYDGTNL